MKGGRGASLNKPEWREPIFSGSAHLKPSRRHQRCPKSAWGGGEREEGGGGHFITANLIPLAERGTCVLGGDGMTFCEMSFPVDGKGRQRRGILIKWKLQGCSSSLLLLLRAAASDGGKRKSLSELE